MTKRYDWRPLEPPYEMLVGETAQEFFAEIVEPHFKIFEWGSGAGSLWFAQHAAEVISVENWEPWYEYLLTIAPPNLTLKLAAGRAKSPTQEEEMVRYIATIDEYPDSYFDLVFSDGWDESRGRCPRRAMAKVKVGGWLVIDNMEWNPPQRGAVPVQEAGWPETRKYGVVVGERIWDGLGRRCVTSFFQRPE